jgi:hypothetical protein
MPSNGEVLKALVMLWLATGLALGLACGYGVGFGLPRYVRLLDAELTRVKAAVSNGDQTEALQLIMETGWPPRVPARPRSLPMVPSPATSSALLSDYLPNRPATARP